VRLFSNMKELSDEEISTDIRSCPRDNSGIRSRWWTWSYHGAEFTLDAVSVCMVEVMAIVTSIEVAAMATVTTDIMAITPIVDTTMVVIRSCYWPRYFRRRFRRHPVTGHQPCGIKFHRALHSREQANAAPP